MVAYLPFDGDIRNAIAGGPTAKPFGNAARVGKAFLGGGLHLTGGTNGVGGVRLEGSEKIAFGPNGSFALSLWARLPQSQLGDPALIANKDWRLGVNPGFVLTAAKSTPGSNWPGTAFNCGTKGGEKRLDLGAFHATPGAWTFYAVVRTAEGVVTLYQGGADGRFNWISSDGSDMVPKSGLPIVLGQDGTGAYRFGLEGDMDEVAIWTRELSADEVRRIYEKGRQGLGLADLM